MKHYYKAIGLGEIFFFFLVFTMFIINGCKKDDPIESPPPDTIIADETKHVTSTELSGSLVSISSDSSTLVFRQGTQSIDNLKTNDILVSENGLGILRRITSVSKTNNQITFTTTQATITEVIQKGKASVIQSFSPSDTLNVLYKCQGVSLHKSLMNPQGFFLRLSNVILYDNDGNYSTTSDQIIADGSIDVSPTFTFSIDIDDWQLKECTFGTGLAEDVDLRVRANILGYQLTKEKELFRSYLSPVVLFIGFVPIVITPVMTVVVGADLKIYVAVASRVTQHAEFTAGLNLHDGVWSPFINESHSFDFEPPVVTAGAKLKGYFGPRLSFLLYGIVGPYSQTVFYGELDADVSRNPWATFYAGIQVGGGVNLEILGHNLANVARPDLWGLKLKIWESTSAPGGTISGTVRDASTNSPISNVKVEIFQGTNLHSTVYSRSTGAYEASLPAYNGYKVVFSKTGYLNEDYQNVNVIVGSSTILEPILQINQNNSGNGNISGTIKNALDGSGIGTVVLKLRKGINVTSGTVVTSTTTNSNGYYSVSNLLAGNYTAEATKSNYNTTYFSVLSLGNQSKNNQDATMSPILASGETRIVLTWGATPNDLDSHLTGPLSDGTRFHMYYIYQGSGSPWPGIVMLDLDDTYSYGPETTTLYGQLAGIYRFSVHDYSNRSSTTSTLLSNSSAQVRVYKSNGLVATFNVPQNTGGTLWTVFEMDGSTITPVNTMTYVSNSSQINSHQNMRTDAVLMRNLPKK